MKAYITKYALTKGILEANTSNWEDPTGFVRCEVFPFCSFRRGHEIFGTMAEAKQHAEQMRLKKIASLQRQIDKLEDMRFVE